MDAEPKAERYATGQTLLKATLLTCLALSSQIEPANKIPHRAGARHIKYSKQSKPSFKDIILIARIFFNYGYRTQHGLQPRLQAVAVSSLLLFCCFN